MTATVRGIDVSENNARQDWKAHVKTGVNFAFIKASEGNHTRDHAFSVHLTDVIRAKIPVQGGYHFAWPNESAATNAANFIGAVRGRVRPGFVLALDLEPSPGGQNFRGTTPAGRAVWVRDWLTAVHRAYPAAALLVYAGAAYDDEVPTELHVDGHAVSVGRWYPRYPWMHPTWALAEAAAQPVRHGRGVQFWQFCGADLDRSLWYGTLADLERWASWPASSAPAAPGRPKPTPPKTPPRQITVRAGMTLSSIALLLGASVGQLAHYNHIKDPNRIFPGQVISAPPVAPAKPAPKPKPRPKPAPAAPKPRPKPAPKPRPAPAYTVHVVRKGDTLSRIAASAGTSWRALATYNHLTHPDLIHPGDKIRLPKGK